LLRVRVEHLRDAAFSHAAANRVQAGRAGNADALMLARLLMRGFEFA